MHVSVSAKQNNSKQISPKWFKGRDTDEGGRGLTRGGTLSDQQEQEASAIPGTEGRR